MAKIHASSIVDPQAELAFDVEVGPFCRIGPNVKIAEGTKEELLKTCEPFRLTWEALYKEKRSTSPELKPEEATVS